MKIKMIHEITGLVDGTPWPPRGGVIDINDDEAKRLIEIGAAEVPGKGGDKASEVETADADVTDVETAAIDTQPKKRAARRA